MIATLSPFGRGALENAKPKSNNSAIVSTRMIPDCLNDVSNAKSLPASAPVCEDAAAAPAELEPDLSTIIGFLTAVSLMVLRKSSLSEMDSK